MAKVVVSCTVRILNEMLSEVQIHGINDESEKEIKILYFKQTAYIYIYMYRIIYIYISFIYIYLCRQ